MTTMTTTTTPHLSSKILITGGAGFTGSNLVDHFLQQGHKVICLDNFSTGKRKNLAEANSHSSFTLIEGDIRNLTDCQKAVEGCDYGFRSSAPSGRRNWPSALSLCHYYAQCIR